MNSYNNINKSRMSEFSQQSSQIDSQEQKQKKSIHKMISSLTIPSQAPSTNSKIVINLSLTHYDVIQEVAYDLGWKVIRNNKSGSPWDILWTDHHIQPEQLIRLQLYQKVSHFPGIHVLARKNLLGISLMDMHKRAPQYYNFFPKTWLLPAQYAELRKQFNGEDTYIAKPEADCQGRGIFLTQKIQQLQNGKHYVIQQYIDRPLLVQGLKFDFRVYVLLCGVSPLRLYIYEEGLARFATEPYVIPNKHNIKKQFMHLTNYAINKKNPRFIYNTSNQRMDVGHKRSLTSVLKIIQKRGHNLKKIKENINDVIIKTLLLGHPLVAHQYRFCQPNDEQRNMCFHLLGIDVMLDQNCKPFVLEVNHTPSFVTDTPLDYHIKYSLIADTLNLMNINERSRAQAYQRISKIQKERNIGRQKRQLYENIDRQQKVKMAQQERDKYEDQHLGRFSRIYPLADSQQMMIYEQLLEIAEKAYFSDNNVLRAQMEKEKANEESNIPKEDKGKKSILDQLGSLKIRKIVSTIQKGSVQLENPICKKRQRIGSFVEDKSKKSRVLFDLKQAQKQLLPELINNSLRLSKHMTSAPKSIINKKLLPKLLIPDNIQSSPNRTSQNTQNSNYKKKNILLLKNQQQQQQRLTENNMRYLKQVIKVAQKKSRKQQKEEFDNESEEQS